MKTLILGASKNPSRYAYKAAEMLLEKKHEIVLLGSRVSEVHGHTILDKPDGITNIDTVTVYLSAKNQIGYEDFLIKLKPRRVIFNPGAENPKLEKELIKNNIKCIEACTFVMLSTGQY